MRRAAETAASTGEVDPLLAVEPDRPVDLAAIVVATELGSLADRQFDHIVANHPDAGRAVCTRDDGQEDHDNHCDALEDVHVAPFG